ncbi:MAG TPA: hypothetical protein VFN03_10255 [Trueperaceae bacterium]|nr:hypothetical protein [Trueperaceae bacterium]
MRGNNVRRIIVVLAVTSLLGGIVSSQMIEAPSGNLATQLATAVTHAGFSANAEAIEMATTHLGHVLNCIVGTGGEGFNADWGNPCGSQGEGIINELASHPQAADLQALVESARALAAQGVTQTSLVAVQTAAAGVAALLSVITGPG